MMHEIRRILVPLAAVGLLSGCLSPPEAEVYEDVVLSAEELYEEATAILEEGRRSWIFKEADYLDAIDVYQEIIDNYPFSDYAILAELQIADSYFERDRFEEALSYYRDFADLHPDHPKVPYTIWRSALCLYEQTYEASRDQDPTRQAINQLEVMMRHYPDAPESVEAEALWKELRERLATREMQVGDFYMEREEFQSAADRFRRVLDAYPGLGLDGDALYKLGVCYQRMNRDDEATEIFEVILRNFEGTEVAQAAEEAIPAAN